MIAGRVVDVYGKYVKVKTQRGEKILKMKGRKVPDRGWILEFQKDNGKSSPFVGSLIMDSLDPLPPLSDLVPFLDRGISDPVDVTFLSSMTKSVISRLGKLPKWYYDRLAEYYQKGESRSKGIYSDLVAKMMKAEKVKPDRLKAFGDWLNTFSHPFYFRSYSNDPKPIKVFLNKIGSVIRIEHFSKDHGKVIVEGMMGKTGARLKVIPEKPIDQKAVDELQKRLSSILGNAFVVQGGRNLGLYV